MNQEETKVTGTEAAEEVVEETAATEEAVQGEKETKKEKKAAKKGKEAALQAEIEKLQSDLNDKQDTYLRLAAEYENYRKRSVREKENTWTDAKAATVEAFLPVYDNLERAVKQATTDEAYAKGVEMTFNQIKEVFKKLNVEIIDPQGEPFDPMVHNAVMHVDDETLGENVVAEVFQAGFRTGDKVIRCAMVKVAN